MGFNSGFKGLTPRSALFYIRTSAATELPCWVVVVRLLCIHPANDEPRFFFSFSFRLSYVHFLFVSVRSYALFVFHVLLYETS